MSKRYTIVEPIKCYSELIKIPTFEERFEYLMLGGRVGETTFGFDRYLNQAFYRSKEWWRVRDYVIIRDSLGGDYPCDLADPDHPIVGVVTVHHMNPIREEDLEDNLDLVIDPEFLITTVDLTHKGIHYGDKSFLPPLFVERCPRDTCLWEPMLKGESK